MRESTGGGDSQARAPEVGVSLAEAPAALVLGCRVGLCRLTGANVSPSEEEEWVSQA